MSKIDEYKELFNKQRVECACGDIYYASDNSIIQIALEQLRPYVELGELYYTHETKSYPLIDYDIDKVIENRDKLIEQIKEQSNESK